MIDQLLNAEVGDYLCEDLDVSEFETIHIDSGGDRIAIRANRITKEDVWDVEQQVVLECRGPDGWYVVEEGELPITSDHFGAELRVREEKNKQ